MMVSPSITWVTFAVSGGEVQPLIKKRVRIIAESQILLVILPHPLSPSPSKERGN